MFDMLFAGLGIKPEDIKAMGEEFIQNSRDAKTALLDINVRLQRIEAALNIEGKND